MCMCVRSGITSLPLTPLVVAFSLQLAGPRYMQQTGEAKKKKLVLLKIGESNAGGGGKSGGVGAAAGAGPPFFKQRMPIGDIIADVTAFTSDGGKTTTVIFYDSIYNCTATYSLPSCAMTSLNEMKIAKKGESGERRKSDSDERSES